MIWRVPCKIYPDFSRMPPRPDFSRVLTWFISDLQVWNPAFFQAATLKIPGRSYPKRIWDSTLEKSGHGSTLEKSGCRLNGCVLWFTLRWQLCKYEWIDNVNKVKWPMIIYSILNLHILTQTSPQYTWPKPLWSSLYEVVYKFLYFQKLSWQLSLDHPALVIAYLKLKLDCDSKNFLSTLLSLDHMILITEVVRSVIKHLCKFY